MTTTFYREQLQSFLAGKKVLLGPMAGVSDTALRSLCLAQGADMTYTEMVSSKALSYANEKTRALLDLAEGEQRVAVQLFGHEPATMARQAAWVEDYLGDSLAYIDINMGCPARKICTKGDGSALMNDPELAARIVSETQKAVAHAVTVKFRRGFYEGRETAVEFAQRMEQAGACACAVHGRYAQQMYRGASDVSVIASVKRAVRIPVVGNGDIKSGADAVRTFEQTNCDSIMVARAAEGNPWVFSQIKAALVKNGLIQPACGASNCAESQVLPEGAAGEPSVAQRIDMARTHARLLSQREGRNICRMRKHAMWYMTGLPGAAAARGRINQCVTLDDFNEVFDELLETARQHEASRPHAPASASPFSGK